MPVLVILWKTHNINIVMQYFTQIL